MTWTTFDQAATQDYIFFKTVKVKKDVGDGYWFKLLFYLCLAEVRLQVLSEFLML